MTVIRGHPQMSWRRGLASDQTGVDRSGWRRMLSLLLSHRSETVTATRDLRMRRMVGDMPPVLLLGAGASADAGIGATPELFKFSAAPISTICKYVEATSTSERYRYLSN